MKNDYVVLMEANSKDLAAEVNSFLDLGYNLVGGVFSNATHQKYQALVRVESTELQDLKDKRDKLSLELEINALNERLTPDTKSKTKETK